MKKIILLGLLCAFSTNQLCAQTTSSAKPVWEEYDKLINPNDSIAPLTSDLFGDQVSLYTGGLSFNHADTSIPGNSSLPVGVSRSFAVSNRKGYGENQGAFADWEIDLPNISGNYAPAWPDVRCSQQLPPPTITKPVSGAGAIYFKPTDYWYGNQISIPGVASGELLKARTDVALPTTGGPHYWVASTNTYFSCLSTIKNATGEGFLAITPDGTKYWFDWLARTNEPVLEKTVKTINAGAGEYLKTEKVFLIRMKNTLYATRVEDRFGNWVTYNYSNASTAKVKIDSIQSNDGRQITFVYDTKGFVSQVSNGTNVWNYAYSVPAIGAIRTVLSQVTRPDGSRWEFNLSGISNAFIDYEQDGTARSCFSPGSDIGYSAPGIIKHPSGAIGEFTLGTERLGRSNVPMVCENYTISSVPNDPSDDVAVYPIAYDANVLLNKKISGLGVVAAEWNYTYNADMTWAAGTGPVCTTGDCRAPVCLSDTCAGKLVATVTQNNGEWTRYTYGNSYRYNEAKLLKTENGSGALTTAPLKTEISTYEYATSGQSYPTPIGTSLQKRGDGFTDEYIRPLKNHVVAQDGVSFDRTTNSFDLFANPTRITKSSSLGYSKSDSIEYEHNYSKWVLSLSTRILDFPNGVIESSNTYDPLSSQLTSLQEFGALKANLLWNADGTLQKVIDPFGRIASFSNYSRGIAQRIDYPDSTFRTAAVNSNGLLTSLTDQLGSTTVYTYDAMNRLSSITPPTSDTITWTGTTQTFAINTVAAYGLPAGHWKQTISKGNYRKEIYFNAMWQPVVTREYDNSNIVGTQRFTRMAYDTSGRPVFASYPGITDELTTGVRTEYDALGRVTKTLQDSELVPNLGVLTTTTEYLTGFQTRVTNPRGFATTTSYQVFDSPDTSRPEIIVSPQGMTTTMLRNVYGNTLSVARSGVWNNAPLNSTRSYVYDSQQRLCKRIEPETGATIIDYDAVGNLAWSVQGSALTSATSCDRTSVAAADKTIRSYDTLSGRLLAVDVPGTINDLSYSYFNDGTLKSLISGTNRWDYTYNKLRLPVTEQLTIDSRVKTLTHAYNSMAQESSLTYPSGLVVATTPNALGQVSQAGTFATGVNYHPMGGMSIFNYGNGIVHRMTPNTRQLPSRSWDLNGTIAVLDDTYTFDANGNVASITDGTAGAGGNRTMSYDNADRLTQTIAPNLAWMSNTFSYDALDNIRANTLGGRAYTYQYNATTKRLDQLTLPNATVARNLAYDPQGNVTTNGAQSYVFDKANRMQSVNGIESYQYDGHGRRVKTIRSIDGKTSYAIYSLEGKLVTDDDQRSNKTIDYVYLNGSLVAKRSAAIGTSTYTTSYQHTDSLGSPVAESDAAKTVTFIKRYTPYGEPSDQNYIQGPGFTGHVTDAATGLTYAQQRYYDPMLGRFLSVDPVASNLNDGSNFNRYWYGNNNPYRFTDPDGRVSDDPRRQHRGAPISGNAQVSSKTPTHASTSQRIANTAAHNPNTKSVHLNQSLRTVTGDSSAPNIRPDVTVVNKNGSIDMTEVTSTKQTTDSQIKKLDAARSNLGVPGRNIVVDADAMPARGAGAVRGMGALMVIDLIITGGFEALEGRDWSASPPKSSEELQQACREGYDGCA